MELWRALFFVFVAAALITIVPICLAFLEKVKLQRAAKWFGEADAFIDATGWDVYDIGMRLLQTGGRVFAYGVPDSGVHYDGTLAYFRDIRILCKVYDFERTVDRMQKLLAEGRIDLKTFVTHHFPLERAPEAVLMAVEEPGKVLGMVIDVA